jgi:selenophosphate synthetase-related protein
MDDMSLEQLLDSVRTHAGLTRKAAVGDWTRRFAAAARARPEVYGPGDDAGAVKLDGGYLLLAGEGIWPGLLADPRFAGFCSVTVNVNDIYAMGGRPLGVVAVVFTGGITEEARDGFLDGMSRGLAHYDVPMLGGHTSPDGETPAIAVCMAGVADRLLRGDGARPGHRIIAALDLEGARRDPFFAWDTVTSAEPGRTASMLSALPECARRELCTACRDISNPGILGTTTMMLEASGAGARLRIDAIPVPEGVDLEWWLKAYPSFGFVFAASPERSDDLLQVLGSRGIASSVIGEVTEGSILEVSWKAERGLFLDWRATPVTGLFS